MSSNFPGGVAGIRPVKLSTTSVTDIVSEAKPCVVSRVYCTEIAGGVAALSLEVYDGTTSTYFIRSKPMTARQTLMWEEIPLDAGMKLRATGSIANNIDVIAIVVEPGQG